MRVTYYLDKIETAPNAVQGVFVCRGKKVQDTFYLSKAQVDFLKALANKKRDKSKVSFTGKIPN